MNSYDFFFFTYTHKLHTRWAAVAGHCLVKGGELAGVDFYVAFTEFCNGFWFRQTDGADWWVTEYNGCHIGEI